MSVIIVYVELELVLYFMQTFGFVCDNMLIWVQYYAYKETKLPFYIWGVVGAIIHDIMLTLGIIDPVMGDNGPGLAVAGMLLVPMMYCYTMFVMLYVQNWRENHYLPFLHLGADEKHPHHFLGVSDFHPAFHDLYWGCPLDGDSLVKEKGKNMPPKSPTGPGLTDHVRGELTINPNADPQPSQLIHISTPKGDAGGVQSIPLSTITAIISKTVSEAQGGGLLQLQKEYLIDRSKGSFTMILIRRRFAWVVGFVIAVLWLIALLAILNRI